MCPSALSPCADVHFQYNGFLLGIFLLSINALLRQEPLWGAFWFAVLLQFKHIFLYVAPVYFVYLLFHYCMRRDAHPGGGGGGGPIRGLHFGRLVQLACVVVCVFGAALGPFLWWGQGAQLLARLFPFQRGLCHAYWAPNVWVFYNLADKLLIAAARRLHVDVGAVAGASTSRGLVEDVAHVVLPTVRSAFTFVLTVAAMAPVLVKLARRPHPAVFLSALTYCSLCSFMLGQCTTHTHTTSLGFDARAGELTVPIRDSMFAFVSSFVFVFFLWFVSCLRLARARESHSAHHSAPGVSASASDGS